jgi:hypothetical protein
MSQFLEAKIKKLPFSELFHMHGRLQSRVRLHFYFCGTVHYDEVWVTSQHNLDTILSFHGRSNFEFQLIIIINKRTGQQHDVPCTTTVHISVHNLRIILLKINRLSTLELPTAITLILSFTLHYRSPSSFRVTVKVLSVVP